MADISGTMKKICFVLDKSGSMKGSRIEAAKAGMLRFVQDIYTRRAEDIESYSGTHISFISYNDLVETRVSLQPVSIAISKLKNALDRTNARNMSALWDAVGEAVRELGSLHVDGEPWAVVLTDGKDNSSRKFTPAKIMQYAKKKGIGARMIFIALGNSVDADEIYKLVKHFDGQYLATSTDPLSIRGAYLQARRSIMKGTGLTPKLILSIPLGRYGELEPDDLAKLGVTVRKKTEKDSTRTDIFHTPPVELSIDTLEAGARRTKAQKGRRAYRISKVGEHRNEEIFGIVDTLTNETFYSKLKKDSLGRYRGACTCEDFQTIGMKLGIPCIHLWMNIGIGEDAGDEEEGIYRESIAQLLSAINTDQLGIDKDIAATIMPIIQEKLGPLLFDSMLQMSRRKGAVGGSISPSGTLQVTEPVRMGETSADTGRSTRISRGMNFAEKVKGIIAGNPRGLTKQEICEDLGIRTPKGLRKVEITLKFLNLKGLTEKKGERWVVQAS